MEENYKVVKIIDTENLIINAGKENYIKKGDRFEIYVIGKEVKDLDGNSLGTLDTIKEVVTAVAVFPKMCVCQKLVESGIATITNITINHKTPAPLDVDTIEFSGGLAEDLTIHIGDLARLTD